MGGAVCRGVSQCGVAGGGRSGGRRTESAALWALLPVVPVLRRLPGAVAEGGSLRAIAARVLPPDRVCWWGVARPWRRNFAVLLPKGGWPLWSVAICVGVWWRQAPCDDALEILAMRRYFARAEQASGLCVAAGSNGPGRWVDAGLGEDLD